MVKELREQYNSAFTAKKYEAFVNEINSIHQPLQFRIAETPVFVPKFFTDRLINTCEYIIDFISKHNFTLLTRKSIPENREVPHESSYPDCMVFDFGVSLNQLNKPEPHLIEMQGFPSLFAFEVLLNDVFFRHFPAVTGYSGYLSGLDRDSYLQLLKTIVVKNHAPENVILLEIFPETQKTNIDFYCTRAYLGVQPVCITQLIKKGRQLYYVNKKKEILIKRIYNRIIFDELLQQEQWVQKKARVLFEDLDVEWCPHPNWFYRISKYTLPLMSHPDIPETRYLHSLQDIPDDLENYVLKPLFSFAGQGVVIDVTKKNIDGIKDPHNWILQRKVHYAPLIDTPEEPAKAEIRIFYFWPDAAKRPIPVNSLARLSRDKMIGVRYNKNKSWTGGSFCLFEQDQNAR